MNEPGSYIYDPDSVHETPQVNWNLDAVNMYTWQAILTDLSKMIHHE